MKDRRRKKRKITRCVAIILTLFFLGSQLGCSVFVAQENTEIAFRYEAFVNNTKWPDGEYRKAIVDMSDYTEYPCVTRIYFEDGYVDNDGWDSPEPLEDGTLIFKDSFDSHFETTFEWRVTLVSPSEGAEVPKTALTKEQWAELVGWDLCYICGDIGWSDDGSFEDFPKVGVYDLYIHYVCSERVAENHTPVIVGGEEYYYTSDMLD